MQCLECYILSTAQNDICIAQVYIIQLMYNKINMDFLNTNIILIDWSLKHCTQKMPGREEATVRCSSLPSPKPLIWWTETGCSRCSIKQNRDCLLKLFQRIQSFHEDMNGTIQCDGVNFRSLQHPQGSPAGATLYVFCPTLLRMSSYLPSKHVFLTISIWTDKIV